MYVYDARCNVFNCKTDLLCIYIYIFIHHMWYIYIDSFFFRVIFYVILHFQINIIIPNLAARKQY